MTNEQSFSVVDKHFARLMVRLEGRASHELELAALLVSHEQANGNICLPLAEVSPEVLPELPFEFDNFPQKEWAGALRRTIMVGRPSEFRPLILDEKDRLYLRRYWEYEDFLAKAIKERVRASSPKFDAELLGKGLSRLFPKSGGDDRQRLAAKTAITRNFTVITGGPGTGKTRTVVAILALLLEQNPNAFRVALAAPSGKAAARLKESLVKASESLHLPPEIRARMPNDAATIHRLLGTISGSPYFRRAAEDPLVVDAVIIDEASMVDLATMAKLFAAIPPEARVILLGDKDQLTSVEAGYVLGDICAAKVTVPAKSQASGQLTLSFENKPDAELENAIVELRQSYRFDESSGIHRVITAVNRGDVEAAITLLKSKSLPDVTWEMLPSQRSLAAGVRRIAVSGYRSSLETDDPAEALTRFDNFRVLCAVRYGPYGVSAVNQLIEQSLAEAGLIKEIRQWYRGRPVLVTRNDYNSKLFNGDVGITLSDPEAPNEKRIFFSSKGKLRRILPARLPVHETAFAMTVHKSQGSEFDRVLLILPESESPVLTRELLYTGLTRARSHVEIWATEKVLRFALGRRVRRNSGLRDALWDR